MFRWAIDGKLAGGPRPRVPNKPLSQVSRSIVDEWIRQAKGKRDPISDLPARSIAAWLVSEPSPSSGCLTTERRGCVLSTFRFATTSTQHFPHLS
jgi:hypothetical protein